MGVPMAPRPRKATVGMCATGVGRTVRGRSLNPGACGSGRFPPMRLQLTIEGMLAVHARHAVFTALGAVEGIMRADVELGRAELELDERANETAPLAVTLAAIHEAIAAAGFRVSEVRPLPRTLPTLAD